MKRSLLIAAIVFAGTLMWAQTSLLDIEVAFNARTTTVGQLLKAMERAGGFTFSYGNEVQVQKMVTVSGMKISIGQHLDNIFEGDSLRFVERNRKILILPSPPPKTNKVPTQVLKGRVIDAKSRKPLSGANLVLESEGPQRGCTTDENGFFYFRKVPVGNHSLLCSLLGYEKMERTNLEVHSGKEMVLLLDLDELVYPIEEVKITHHNDPSLPANRLVVVSGRSFSAYEVENFPGSLSDISRAAVSFPGVISPNDGQNHMIIRGNSPKGLQWRLEGIEIPNLNHFSEIGASGGGINVLSNNMLSKSDFLTGAFPAEYGNALSGVFDLRLRTGNNDKHEQTLQLGILGAEAMVEGPLSRKTGTTYIAQYRYSTLKILSKLGIGLESVPDFQDLSFKIFHPTKKAGTFTLFGIGGISHEVGTSGYVMDSDMLTGGLSHKLSLGEKTFLHSVVALSGRTFGWYDKANIGTAEEPVDRTRESSILDYSARTSVSLDRKLGRRHSIRAGLMYEMAWNDSWLGWRSDTLQYVKNYVDGEAQAATLQSHLNWNWRLTEALTMNTGIHYIQFYLNKKYSIEPRFGVNWSPNPQHSLSAGFGIHSRKESMTLYMGERTLEDGSIIMPNLNLELSKARHFVLAYQYRINMHTRLKTELYYQSLYDIPASPFPPYFTTMNFDYGFEGSPLLSYGSGYNTGMEILVEQQMQKGFSFLWNGTFYDSRYRDRPGNLLHTKYNGRYATNGLICKEFRIGSGRQHLLSISSRYILTGGLRYLPVDKAASAENAYTVRIWDNGFTEKGSDYFRIDLLFKILINRERYSSEWSLDLVNITNRQNPLGQYWDNASSSVLPTYQNPFLVFINYRIQF